MKSLVPLILLACIHAAAAELRVHHIFGDNMVLQRGKPVSVRGWAEPGAAVQVSFAGRQHAGRADPEGAWTFALEPMQASNEGRKLVIEGDGASITYTNVVVGDLWLCGGQSNMEDVLESIYHGDIEVASANHPLIRLMTIPVGATPEPREDFERINEFNAWTNRHEQKGSWFVCSPKTVPRFSAIGYVFGRRLQLVTGVPIGLIDNAVGGTTVEGWTSRASLAAIPEAKGLLEDWDTRIAEWDAEQDLANRIKNWERDTERRKAKGEKPNPKPEDLRPGPAFDRNNPGASYNAMLASLRGSAIKGIIFNQGYNNALRNTRPNLYGKTIQAMIGDWRAAFGDPELPFGIVELTAGAAPQTPDNFELKMVDAAPWIREAQFKAYRELKNMGWAGAYDQQVPWYHPHKKLQLGERMARWALTTQYEGYRFGHEPAVVTGHSVTNNRVVISFDRNVKVQDNRPIEGMAVAGEDRVFWPAQAALAIKGYDKHKRPQYDQRKVEVWSPFVAQPVAVRYAWARSPLGNLANSAHHERFLPVPSFRTDDWDWPDAPFGPEERNVSGKRWREARQAAEKQMKLRKLKEAEAELATLKATDSK